MVLSGIQGLVVALHSGITTVMLWGAILDVGDQNQIVHVQDKCLLHCAIIPVPISLHFQIVVTSWI